MGEEEAAEKERGTNGEAGMHVDEGRSALDLCFFTPPSSAPTPHTHPAMRPALLEDGEEEPGPACGAGEGTPFSATEEMPVLTLAGDTPAAYAAPAVKPDSAVVTPAAVALFTKPVTLATWARSSASWAAAVSARAPAPSAAAYTAISTVMATPVREPRDSVERARPPPARRSTRSRREEGAGQGVRSAPAFTPAVSLNPKKMDVPATPFT